MDDDSTIVQLSYPGSTPEALALMVQVTTLIADYQMKLNQLLALNIDCANLPTGFNLQELNAALRALLGPEEFKRFVAQVRARSAAFSTRDVGTGRNV